MFKFTTLRAAVALACMVALAGCGSDGDPSSAASAEETEAPLQTIEFGKGAGVEGFEFGLQSVRKRKQIGEAGLGPAAGPDETFVVARYVVRNVGPEPVESANFPQFDLIDGTGQVYEKDGEATMVAGFLYNDIHSGPLNPKVTAPLVAIWKVNATDFDPKVWRIKVSFDQGLNAMAKKAARWPLETQFPPPVLLELQ